MTLFFQLLKGRCHGKPILRAKLAKLAYSPSFIALAFRKGLDYHNTDFKRFIYDGLHPLVDQQFGYVRLAASLLDLTEISRPTEFCGGAISTQFCFTAIRWEVSLLCCAGYMLGSATHFWFWLM